jgi:hypothetical protein
MLNHSAEDKNRRIQSRNMEISTREDDGAHIVVCGELRDRRLVTTFALDGTERQAATVHHMRICIKVHTGTLAIEAIEGEMLQVPHADCGQMHKTLEAIQGLTLSPGFSAKVKQQLGGPRGCIHLTTLLLAMAPAALQGYWTHNDRVPERRRVSGEHLERYLVDTCRVWRREGPLVQKIAKLAGVDLSGSQVEKE